MMPRVFRRRVESYDSKADIERLMHKLMSMDDKLDEILERLDGEEDDEEEPD
jgi:hypothetical protein